MQVHICHLEDYLDYQKFFTVQKVLHSTPVSQTPIVESPLVILRKV